MGNDANGIVACAKLKFFHLEGGGLNHQRDYQGVVVGNPDLDPQKLDNLEFELIHWGRDYRLGINLYGYKLTDQITVINPPGGTLMFSNNGDETGYGFEFDSAYTVSDALSLKANYTYHDTTEPPTNAIGAAPKHLLYAEANWEFLPQTFFDLNVRGVFDRDRSTRDPRLPVDDYVTVNFSIRKEDLHGVGLAFTLRNLFDEDARDPSSDNGLSSIVPLADTPLPGREFWGELRVRF
jgi:outer membrane receptor protein involved in Fe transport